MSEKYKWAILGTGAVANRFAKALANITDQAELVAVGSRTQASAEKFAEIYGIPAAHGSYQAVADDPNVDIVYIGTPHPVHHKDAKICLEAGKHVLCEKAFTMNAEEAEDLIKLAREKNLFLMEAMWTSSFPDPCPHSGNSGGRFAGRPPGPYHSPCVYGIRGIRRNLRSP